jgi:hypothetical protein
MESIGHFHIGTAVIRSLASESISMENHQHEERGIVQQAGAVMIQVI